MPRQATWQRTLFAIMAILWTLGPTLAATNLALERNGERLQFPIIRLAPRNRGAR